MLEFTSGNHAKHITININATSLPLGIRIKLIDRLHQSQASIADNQFYTIETALFQMPQKTAPASLPIKKGCQNAWNRLIR